MSYPIVIVKDCQMDKAANEGTTQLKPMEASVFVDDDEAKNGKVTFWIKQPSGKTQVIRTGLLPLTQAIAEAALNREEA